MKISCVVDGKPVALSEVTARSVRTPNLVTAPFQATIERAVFIDYIAAVLPGLREWADEYEDLPDFVNELVRRGWPTAEEVAADDGLLSGLILFNDLDLAAAIFGQPDSAVAPWIVNSIEKVTFTPTAVVLSGEAGTG